MKSPNFTVFLLIGYYLAALCLFQHDGERLLGTTGAYLGFCSVIIPLALVLRRRVIRAAGVGVTMATFTGALLFIGQGSVSLERLLVLANHPGLPIYMFLGLVLPGLFMVSELDSDRLPHELSHWTGSSAFGPLTAVLAGRDRLLRRLMVIRETCYLRGIDLSSPLHFLRKPFVWLVPLTVATICEAAYAHSFREMLGSPHRFAPTRPKRPRLSYQQKLLFAFLILTWLWGIGHQAHHG